MPPHEDSESWKGAHLSRRSLLRAGAVGVVASVAGCAGQSKSPPSTPTDAAGQSKLVDAIEFDVGDLLLRLVSDHDVSRVNLIDPNGELFTSASVATGQRTVRLQILDIDLGLGGYTHYTPGQHEIVLVRDGTSDTLSIDLRPEVAITDIKQYRQGTRDSDYGRLAVTVKNSGTGPTWVYEINYQDSPNYAANGGSLHDPGVVTFEKDRTPEHLVIPPSGSRTYVGTQNPLMFPGDGEMTCNGDFHFQVMVGVATGQILTREITAKPTGEAISAGYKEHVCTNSTISLSPGKRND